MSRHLVFARPPVGVPERPPADAPRRAVFDWQSAMFDAEAVLWVSEGEHAELARLFGDQELVPAERVQALLDRGPEPLRVFGERAADIGDWLRRAAAHGGFRVV